MAFFKFLKDKFVYLLVNLVILLIGFLLIKSGTFLNATNGDQSTAVIDISIGTSLIAAAIVMFLDLFRHLSVSQIFGRLQNVIYDAGIFHAYSKRDLDRYDDLIKNMERSLDITGYSLGAFFESYSDILKLKIAKLPITIRIILVNPDSQVSKNRAKDELKGEDAFRDKINTMLKFFKDESKVEIRFFNSPLSSMIFRIDDVMFIGPHFYKKQSKATVTLELKKGQWMFDDYQNEFERMWADSDKVDFTTAIK